MNRVRIVPIGNDLLVQEANAIIQECQIPIDSVKGLFLLVDDNHSYIIIQTNHNDLTIGRYDLINSCVFLLNPEHPVMSLHSEVLKKYYFYIDIHNHFCACAELEALLDFIEQECDNLTQRLSYYQSIRSWLQTL